MNEVRDLLPDYLLDLLDPAEKARVEASLTSSAELRRELDELRRVLFQIPQSLPPIAPPPGTWSKIHSRTRPAWRWWQFAAAAAVLGVLWLGIFGFNRYSAYRALAAEQAKVAHWLADPGAEWKLLKTAQGKSFGTMLWTKDGRCLMILSEPPPTNKVYQAWGRKSYGDPISLGVFRGRVFETHYDGFAFVGVSLEPPGGSPKPTQPLGRVPVS